MSNLTPGPEMDHEVCLCLGIEPERVCIATNDGGKSACATVSRTHGPWYSDRELSDWLIEQKSKGYNKDYVIDYWTVYPPVSTDLACLGLLVEALVAKDMTVEIRLGVNEIKRVRLYNPDGSYGNGRAADTISHALCLAIISARDAGRV